MRDFHDFLCDIANITFKRHVLPFEMRYRYGKYEMLNVNIRLYENPKSADFYNILVKGGVNAEEFLNIVFSEFKTTVWNRHHMLEIPEFKDFGNIKDWENCVIRRGKYECYSTFINVNHVREIYKWIKVQMEEFDLSEIIPSNFEQNQKRLVYNK